MTAVEQPTYNDPTAIKSDALNAQKSVAFDNRYGDDTGQLAADALRQKSALAQKDEAATGELIYGRAKADQKYLKGAEDAINSPRPPLPTYEKIKNEPNPEDYHKYSVEFASASALLGAIAGHWTRAGGTASLNAFAGAMKGWQAGNVQAYEEAYKQWDQASKKTIENNNIELAKYKAILEDRKMNIDEKLQGLTIAGYEARNSVIVGMGKDGNFNGIAQAVDKMAMANQRYGAAVGTLSGVHNDQSAEMQGKIDYLNQNPDAARDLQQRNPVEFAKIAGTAHAMGVELKTPPPRADDQTLRADGQRYHDTGTLPTNMGRGQQGAEEARRIRGMAVQIAIENGEDPATMPTRWQQFKAQQAGLNAEQSSINRRAGNVAIFVDEANNAIPIVRSLAEQNAGKGLATWDAVQGAWKVERGDRGFANYTQQLNTLAGIYSRVVAGGGTGAVADREYMRKYLNPNMPLSAVEGNLDGYATEVQIAKEAPDNVRRQIQQRNQGGGQTPAAPQRSSAPPPDEAIQHLRDNPGLLAKDS